MIEKNATQKVLQVFFESPVTVFYLRELSRLIGKSLPTIITVTDTLARENLISKKKENVMTILKANRQNDYFIRCKRIHNMERLYESGVVDILIRKYNHPQTIVVFGSFSRGEDIQTSDIDLAVNTDKKLKVDLSSYEENLKKRINVHEAVFSRQREAFRISLMNGIVLEGSW